MLITGVAAICGMSHGEQQVRAAITECPDYIKLISYVVHSEEKLREYSSNTLWNVCDGGKEAVKEEIAKAGIVHHAGSMLEDSVRSKHIKLFRLKYKQVFAVRVNACGILMHLADGHPERQALIGLTEAPSLLAQCVNVDAKVSAAGKTG